MKTPSFSDRRRSLKDSIVPTITYTATSITNVWEGERGARAYTSATERASESARERGGERDRQRQRQRQRQMSERDER